MLALYIAIVELLFIPINSSPTTLFLSAYWSTVVLGNYVSGNPNPKWRTVSDFVS